MKRMLMRKPFSKMEGLTLLETMFAIAIGALVLIGAVIFYMSTKQSANASKTVGDMNGIVAGYESYAAGGNTISSATTMDLVQAAGFLPKPLNDAWGYAYTVVVSSGSITITIPGIKGATGTAGSWTGDTNCVAIYNMAQASGTPVSAADTCSVTYSL